MGFVFFVLLAWNAALWALVGKVVAPVVPGGWRTVAVVAVLLVAPLAVLMQGFTGQSYPSAATRVWVLRPFWYGQLFLPALALAALVGLLAGWPVGAAAKAGRTAVAAMAVGLVAMSVWGYAGTRRLAVRPLELRLPTLPPALDGLRVVQLSDLHVGPHTPRRFLARIAAAVAEARPDLVVLTGDQVDDFARDVEPLVGALGGMAAPLGVVAVAGNHDVYAGWAEVRRGMEAAGWRVLVNESIPVEARGVTFYVAGTGDPAGRGGPTGPDPGVVPDVARTLAAVPDSAFTIALAHNPALWPELAARGVALTLSGHTHYGQVAVPRLNWSLASVFLTYAMGTYRTGASTLYINPGTNYWGIPLRLGTPPEVTVITLRRGEG